jgi:hypothetical protein
MVATSLSGVVLMRTAERARPQAPDAAEPGAVQERVAPPEPEPSVPQVLLQMKDLLREMTLLFQEQQQELRRLHDQRKGVTA